MPIARILGSAPRPGVGLPAPDRPTRGEIVGVAADPDIGTDDRDGTTGGVGALPRDETGWKVPASDVTREPIETPGDVSDATGGMNGAPSWPVACCCISCCAVAAA